MNLSPTNCLSVFDHFVGLARKGLIYCFWIFLTHFMLLLASYAPWKYKKTFEFFLCFRGYWERPVAWNGLKRLLGFSSWSDDKAGRLIPLYLCLTSRSQKIMDHKTYPCCTADVILSPFGDFFVTQLTCCLSLMNFCSQMPIFPQ